MTVRTWFTISALVLVALAAAVAFRLTRPAPVPEIAARADGIRLDGARIASCWPARGNDVRCTRGKRDVTVRTIPGAGRMRLFVFPVAPKEGTVRILEAETNDVVERRGWTRSFRYALKRGSYVLEARARYGKSLYVVYDFAFRVTRSGS